jgi:hypothetical protein
MSTRKVALFMMASLDGFFEGTDHELDWHNVDAEFEDFAAKHLPAQAAAKRPATNRPRRESLFT